VAPRAAGGEDRVTVRPARPGDRDALVAAVRSDGTFRPDEVDVAIELIDAGLAGSRDYQLRVVEDDAGAVAGYLCFGSTPMTVATWDLYWVVVDASARGRGLAGVLIAAMEAELRAAGGGHVRVETSVGDGYGAARRLYERLGYPLAANLTDFYGPGDDLLVYYKRIG
jgi:ribosomal protein S18 acetylase RimI-like enzyme